MRGGLSSLSTEAFYARAAKCRIGSYHNLGRDPQRWGDGGFAYASDAYAASGFEEAYGAVL